MMTNRGVLKVVDPYFGMIWTKVKTFELRKNDRDFKVGDIYYLAHYNTKSGVYLDRWLAVEITCVIQTSHLMPDCVALGFKELDRGYRVELKDFKF